MENSEEVLEDNGTIGDLKYSLRSKNWNIGSNSSIVIDGVEYLKKRISMNIDLYDYEAGRASDSVCFDTCDKKMPVYR